VVGSRSELFVNQVYTDVFGAPAGLLEAYWVALINGGYPSKVVANMIVSSGPAAIATVDNSYQRFLGRSATTAELTQALSSRNRSLTTVDINILSSQEFYQTQGGGTINGFLTALAQDWFGKDFPPAVKARLTRQLKQGVSRRQVVENVITSPSGVRAELDTIFETILERPADRKAIARFSTLTKQGQVGRIAVDLFGSSEFTQKFVNLR